MVSVSSAISIITKLIFVLALLIERLDNDGYRQHVPVDKA